MKWSVQKKAEITFILYNHTTINQIFNLKFWKKTDSKLVHFIKKLFRFLCITNITATCYSWLTYAIYTLPLTFRKLIWFHRSVSSFNIYGITVYAWSFPILALLFCNFTFKLCKLEVNLGHDHFVVQTLKKNRKKQAKIDLVFQTLQIKKSFQTFRKADFIFFLKSKKIRDQVNILPPNTFRGEGC